MEITITSEEQAALRQIAFSLERETRENVVCTIRKESHTYPGLSRLRSTLESFKNESLGEVLLIHGVPIGNIPPTPHLEDLVPLLHSEIILLVIGTLLGHVIGYAPEKGGALCHNVFPTMRNLYDQTNEGSAKLLEGHVEIVFHPYKPDYLILLGLRQDPEKEAKTFYLGSWELWNALSESQQQALSRREFELGIDPSYRQYYDMDGPERGGMPGLVPVFAEDKTLCYDQNLMKGTTPAAEEAVSQVIELAVKKLHSVKLTPGTMLILDNKKALHARSSFKANFDGNDRWLQRVLVRNTKPDGAMRGINQDVIEYDFRPYLWEKGAGQSSQ